MPRASLAPIHLLPTTPTRLADAVEIARLTEELSASEARVKALEEALAAALREHEHRKTMQVMLTEPEWAFQAAHVLEGK